MRRRRPATGAVVALVALAACVAGCTRREGPQRLVGTLEYDRIEITAETADPLVSVEVHEGDRVEPGQVLARQDTAVMQAREAEAMARASEARHRLEELERGARIETRQEARARVSAAKALADRNEREFRRVSDLVERRLVSDSQLDDARAARDQAQASLREANAQLAVLVNGTRAEELDQARAALAAAESAQRQLEISNGRLVLKATRAGLVEAIPYKLGERPPVGAPVIVLLADAAPFARVYVPEPLRVSTRAGARARVWIDGREMPFDGVVRFVSGTASFTPYYALTQRDRSRLSFLAEITLTGADAASLPAGVPLEAEILADSP